MFVGFLKYWFVVSVCHFVENTLRKTMRFAYWSESFHYCFFFFLANLWLYNKLIALVLSFLFLFFLMIITDIKLFYHCLKRGSQLDNRLKLLLRERRRRKDCCKNKNFFFLFCCTVKQFYRSELDVAWINCNAPFSVSCSQY